jgi:anti-sigma factor RsiW
MSDPGREIGEDDLQAFVDGQLALERESLVQQYLRAHPGEAQRVAAYKAQRDQLRALFAGGASEPLPPKLQIDNILKYRAPGWWTGWRAVAAIVLATGLGVASGWLMWAPAAPGLPKLATQVLVEQALATYAVYAPDERHPVEMSAADEARLTRWLSERLRRSVKPPDLSKFGYKLLGGRLLATERGGAAAMLMYSNSHRLRVSLLLRPMIPSLTAPDRYITEGPLQLCVWIGKGMGYALAASMPKAEMDTLAEHVRDEL